jgi:hypothetical protein
VKFLLIAKPRGRVVEPTTLEEISEAKRSLQAYFDEGVLERAYTIIGGGGAYVVNAESVSALASGLRNTRMAKHSTVEILLVEEAVAYFQGLAAELE